MNSLVLSLLVNSASASVRNDLPASDGKFFYVKVTNETEQSSTTLVHHSEHMFHTNILAGSKDEKLELQLSST